MRRDAARALDEYLVLSARAGDRRAADRLARRWLPKLLRHARRLLGEAEAARDVAQEAWLDIVQGLARLDDPAAFPAWAFRIVTRRAADWIRHARRRRRLDAAAAAEPRETSAPARDESPDHASLRAALARAMAALPPEQRAAVALFYLEELSVGEIAAALSIPPGTVKTRLMHARRKLRDALEAREQGVTT